MGTTNTKIINSLSSSFGGLTRRDSKKSNSEGSKILFRVRSNSLDSISTALSIGTGSQSCVPSRSTSLDNLHMAPGHTRHTTSHGKRYALLDNESVTSTIKASSLCDEQEGNPPDVRRNTQRAEQFSSSLPAKLEISKSKSSNKPRKREEDEFSDNFVRIESTEALLRPGSLVDVTQDSSASETARPNSMPARSILKDTKASSVEDTLSDLRDDPDLLSKLLSGSPQITPAVLAKFSPEEWDQVITFACASLGQTLHSMRKLSEKQSASDSDKAKETNSNSDDSTQKHVTINEQVSTSMYDRGASVAGMDGTTSIQAINTQERPRQRRRRPRRERPTSLPPVYTRTTESQQQWDDQTELKVYTRARSNSHEGNYCHRCSTEPTKHRGHKTEHYPCSSRSRRRKAPKSQRNPNAPVDVSLDDNCPGVARVRRVHRHTHHHSFCDHYERTDRYHRDRIHSADKDESSKGEARDDSSIFMTLEDMQTAAAVFRRSAEIAESGIARAYPDHNRRRQPSTHRAKHESFEDEEVEVVDSSLAVAQLEGKQLEYCEGWNELVFPKSSRSGRDSPATDMAVIALDLNHPSMLQPIRSKNPYLNNNHSSGSTRPQMFVHSHNHYHHIIHHSQT